VSEWLLPAGTAVAALTLTYFFCVRPMRRGQCASTSPAPAVAPEELDRALVRARAELARLGQDAPGPHTAPSAASSPHQPQL
jgi:hypothetical protein